MPCKKREPAGNTVLVLAAIGISGSGKVCGFGRQGASFGAVSNNAALGRLARILLPG